MTRLTQLPYVENQVAISHTYRKMVCAPGMAHWRLRASYRTVVVWFRLGGAGFSESLSLSPLRTLMTGTVS